MRGHHRLILEKTPHNIRVWSATGKEKLRDLYMEGYSDEHIAEVLHRSVGAVVGMRNLLRLKKKRRPRPTFVIHDAMADYLPTWYIQKLKREWEEKCNGASIK